METRLWPLWMAVAAALVTSCGGASRSYTEESTRILASEDLRCPEREISIYPAGEGTYDAVGCGREARYACRMEEERSLCYRDHIVGREAPGSGPTSGEPASTSETPVATEEPPAEAEADEEDGERATSPDQLSTTEAEAQLRSTLTERRAELLACVDRDSAALRVTLGPGGAEEITLQGELSGGPEEGCVRDLLSQHDMPTTEAPHVVVHLIR